MAAEVAFLVLRFGPSSDSVGFEATFDLAGAVAARAFRALDEDREDAPQLVSCAKARCNDAIFLIGNEAVQMHGGIGVTDDLEIGFFLKRARSAMQIFGDTGYHKDRYATLNGY